MDMVSLGHAFGVVSLIPVVAALICNKGCKPYQHMTLFLGCFLVFSAAMTASTFSNLNYLAKLLDAKHMLRKHTLDQSDRAANLWLLIYPAIVGAFGVNLLTSWFQSSRPHSKRRWRGACELIGKPVRNSNVVGQPRVANMAPVRRRCRKNVRAEFVRRRC